MTTEDVTNETMYCLFAPDGSWQAMTLVPDYATCIAQIHFLHKLKMGKSYFELTQKGFEIRPVQVSIKAIGSAADAFAMGKAAL